MHPPPHSTLGGGLAPLVVRDAGHLGSDGLHNQRKVIEMTKAKTKTKSKRKATKAAARKVVGNGGRKVEAPKAGEPAPAREGSKLEEIITMMRKGATLAEMSQATKWKPASVRGVIQNAVKGRLKMTVTRTKDEKRGSVFTVEG